MKKFISIVLAVLLFTGVSFAQPILLEADDETWFFAGQNIASIDYNGEVFAGICANKVTISYNFENWEVLKHLPDVSHLGRKNGAFIAFGKEVTLRSEDGIHWETLGNNLPEKIRYYAFNNGIFMVFVINFETGTAGTYSSTDGVSWVKVEDIPDGAVIRVVNNKFVLESNEYRKGIYLSENGVDFQRIDAVGSYFCYFNNAYHAIEYIAQSEDDFNRLWTSADLVNWESEMVDCNYLYPHNSLFTMIDKKEYAFNLNGEILVLENGSFQNTGERVGGGYNSLSPPFVYYNSTEYGLFAWTSERLSIYLPDYKQQKIYDHKSKLIFQLLVENDMFYAVTGYYPKQYVYRSADGIHWEPDEDFQFEYGRFHMLEGTNGTDRLQSEFIERGSHAGRDTNPVITARLTTKDGEEKKIAYEYAFNDSVNIQSGDGFFLLQIDNYSGAYVSPDGVSRFPCDFGYINSKAMLIAKSFTYENAFGVIDIKKINADSFVVPIKVKLNEEYLSFATNPVIEEGRTLIPMRFLFERAGASVDWNGEGAVIEYQGKQVTINIDEPFAYVNGEKTPLEVPARLINGKTLVPLRFIAEQFDDFMVSYDETEHTAVIISKE